MRALSGISWGQVVLGVLAPLHMAPLLGDWLGRSTSGHGHSPSWTPTLLITREAFLFLAACQSRSVFRADLGCES